MIGLTHEQTDGINFTIKPIISFEQWMRERYGNMDKFNDLKSRKDKEKMFLKWKWGFNDERANESLEISEHATLNQFEGVDLDSLSPAWKFYIEHKRRYNEIAIETKKRIGLIIERNPDIDRLTETFGGQIV